MKLILLFTNTAIDFNALGQGSLAAMVMTAVFVIIVKPLVNQAIKSNDELSKSIGGLKETIATGDKDVSSSIKESEQHIIEKFASMIEANVVSRESLNEMKQLLAKIESKLDK